MKKKYIVISLLVIVSLLFIYSLIHRIPDIDDSWDGDFAYWQAKLGFVKSELMHGRAMQEVRLICHHKLLTLQGALVINTIGFSLYKLKAISLAYLLLFLFIFYKHAYKKVFSPFYFYLFLLLFISNALIFDFAFVFRPELTLMTFGFISYLLLDKALKQTKSIGLVILSGIFAGLGVATHLNGVIFIIAGVLLLFINKKYLYGFIFGISVLPTAAIYFYDFTPTYNLAFWSKQISELTTDEALSTLPAGLSHLVNLLNEHLRFFHSPKEISFSLLLIASLALAWKNLKVQKNLAFYTAILVVTLGLISVHKSSKYAIIYLPYLMILLVSSLNYIFDRKQSLNITYQRNSIFAVTIFMVLYLSVNTFYNIKLSAVKFYSSDNSELVTKYIHEKTDSLRIAAPMNFIFNEITKFKSIQGDMLYSDLQKKDSTIYKQGFLEFTRKFDIDYIILSEEFYRKFGLNNFTSTDFQTCGFELILKTNKLLIVKNIERYNIRNKKYPWTA